MSAPISDIDHADRRLPFDGAPNFRDLGGYAAADGRQVQWRRVFRSGHLADLTDDDLTLFESLNVGFVCDLRFDGERERRPSRFFERVRPEVMTTNLWPGSGDAFVKHVRDGTLNAEFTSGFMEEIFRGFVNNLADQFAAAFARLLDAQDGAVLMHCTAGKDRTGFAAAALLLALGVDRDTVVEDYMLSARYYSVEDAVKRARKDFADAGAPMPAAEALAPFHDIRPDYILASFDEMARCYGSVEAFIEQGLALGPEQRTRLKNLYLSG